MILSITRNETSPDITVNGIFRKSHNIYSRFSIFIACPRIYLLTQYFMYGIHIRENDTHATLGYGKDFTSISNDILGDSASAAIHVCASFRKQGFNHKSRSLESIIFVPAIYKPRTGERATFLFRTLICRISKSGQHFECLAAHSYYMQTRCKNQQIFPVYKNMITALDKLK